MPGDYTKFTYKPQKRYFSVLLQQGRVQLDADSNEQGEIVKRRWEIQARDTFGHCAVPTSIPDNATAFQITASGGTDLGIGAGHMYVEGLLAEIFEGETFQGQPISYLNQPFFPQPPPLSAFPSAVAYLDVWAREVTYIQDRDLLEKALGGVDTATRIQTVWQVKVTRGNCDTDLDAFFPQSAGRLSSRAVAPPASDDECVIAPSGGYRGLENRLYRVEIHDAGIAGDLDTVRFKWSRENASVISSIAAISAQGSQSQLTVSRIGRDKVLRFKIGDWVEILDDNRELMGQAGAMAQIVDIDEANRRITLNQLVPPDFDATDAARHTRLIRWDQTDSNNIDAEGLAHGSINWIALEDGVEVLLSLPPLSGRFHIGDYWVFAARTSDGSVEELNAAPPRGIIHHYCHLAAITVSPGAPPHVTEDCRHLCAPCAGGGHVDHGVGACCVFVPIGASVQAAIDSLPISGGCVCLAAGEHTISEPIQINRSNVVLHGVSLGARVVRANGVHLLSISSGSAGVIVQNVDVHDITFEVVGTGGQDGNAMVVLNNCLNTAITNCDLTIASTPLGLPLVTEARGVIIENSRHVRISDNRFNLTKVGLEAIRGEFIRVSGNQMAGPPLNTNDLDVPVGTRGVWIGDAVGGPCQVEGNQIQNYGIGISMGRRSLGSLVSSNVIRRPLVDGVTPNANRVYGIEVGASRCIVEKNNINLTIAAYGGILVTGEQVCVQNNTILSETRGANAPLPRGILAGPALGSGNAVPDLGVIRGNFLSGRQDAIVVDGTTSEVQILENYIRGIAEIRGANPRAGITLENTRHATVAGNQIRDCETGIVVTGGTGNRLHVNHLRNGGRGVFAERETNLDVSNNIIVEMASVGFEGQSLREATTVAQNRLMFCGYVPRPAIGAQAPLPFGIGIFVSSSTGEVYVESCEVLDTGRSGEGQIVTTGVAYGIAVFGVQSCRMNHNRVAYSTSLPDLAQEHRALVLTGGSHEGSGHAMIDNNVFSGVGLSNLVELDRIHDLRFEKILFSNNYCDHAAVPPGPKERATVSCWGDHLIVMSNHVKSGANIPSINFNNLKPVVLMGNVTTGGFIKLPASVPAPQDLFNVELP